MKNNLKNFIILGLIISLIFIESNITIAETFSSYDIKLNGNELCIYGVSGLSQGFEIGVDSSGGLSNWLEKTEDGMKMTYPSGERWGSVFIVTGAILDSPRPSKNFSGFKTLSFEVKGEVGGEDLEVGIKDNTDSDYGTEAKIKIKNITTEWQTVTIPLERFTSADLERLYVVMEFVFNGPDAQTVFFRNVKYLTEDLSESGTEELSSADYLWIELSGRFYSSETNYYIKPDEITLDDSLSNYIFLNPNLKIGYRLFPAISKLPGNIILDLYFHSNLIWDVLDKDINKLDWNNNYVYGPGLRLRIPLKSYRIFEQSEILRELNLDFFTEILNIEYLSKVDHSVTHRPDNDFLYGASVYSLLEGNIRKSGHEDIFLNNWWTEIGVGYTYRKNNLFVKEYEDFYLINAAVTFGLPLWKIESDSVSLYLFDLYYKGLFLMDNGDQSWNDVEWNNNIKYGPGLNLLRVNSVKKRSSSSLKKAKFEIFFEYLNIHYLDKVEYIPIYRPNYDLSFGLRFILPLGGSEIN